MSHIYCTHIKDKNLRGFVVNNSIPFYTLYDAETYCMNIGIQPDADHLVYDPQTAKLFASMLLPELERIKSVYERHRDTIYKKVETQAELLKKHRQDRTVMGGVNAQIAQENLANLQGQLEVVSLVDGGTACRIYEMRNILNI